MLLKHINNLIEELDSIKIHTSLNTKLWDNSKLKPEVQKHLVKIAEFFMEYLDIDWVSVKDIVFTGSLASYNYTKYSDIDLHIVLDYQDVHKECPIVDKFFDSKKSLFNDKHNINICGYPVELYVEDEGMPAVSLGRYSILKDDWIIFPKKQNIKINDRAVELKYKQFENRIKEITSESGNLKEAEKISDNLYEKRKSGLSKSGEYSVENIVFKTLRNNGLLKKLKDYILKETDESLSYR